jgi:FkbM family methyltransferase
MSAAIIAEEIRRLRAGRGPVRNHAPDVTSAPTERCAQVEGFTIHFTDAPSLKTAIKDIFLQRIYHFECQSPTPLIIDAGAHIGVSTLYFKRIFPAAKILCLEPDGHSVALLRRNIESNKLSEIEVIQSAVADSDGIADFHADGSDGGRLITSRATGIYAKCRTVRLSSFINHQVDLLKLNIEGQEYPVLQDLQANDKLRHIRRIVLEYHGWSAGPQLLGEILQLLSQNGFRYLVHDFDRETNPATKPPFQLRRAPWFCLVFAEQADYPVAGEDRELSHIRNPIQVDPVSRVFGLDRGQPIDRYYIEKFLEACSGHIRGRALEVADDAYIRRFGGDRVNKIDILHAPPGSKRATVVADISQNGSLPPEAFDCIILTQTLHCMYDIRTAIANACQALKPGGVLLATLPGISQISRYDMDRWGDYWRFTTLSARSLFEKCFSPGTVHVESHGNVRTATAFLQGLSAGELSRAELDHVDHDFELLITVSAHKNG